MFTPTPPPLSLKTVWESRDTHVCVSPCDAGSYQSVFLCVHTHVCLMEGWTENAGEGAIANPYSLWRIQGHSFMFCQPSVNQFPIKVLLNSAVIPIPASRLFASLFQLRFKQPPLPCSPLICCSVSNMSCQCQSGPVRLSNDTSWSVWRTCQITQCVAAASIYLTSGDLGLTWLSLKHTRVRFFYKSSEPTRMSPCGFAEFDFSTHDP